MEIVNINLVSELSVKITKKMDILGAVIKKT